MIMQFKKIQDALLHVIGWRQDIYNSGEFKLSDNITTSESGLYFQDIHPLLTLQNLYSIAPDFNSYVCATYNKNTKYKVGDTIKYNGNVYKCITDNTNCPPIENAQAWACVDMFSEWLEEKTKASIMKLVNKFINTKLADKTTKSLIENKILFDGTGRLTNKIENRNKLVGFEIDTVRSKGVTVKIDKIGLQMTEPGSYTLYIFHSSNPEPIYTLTFEKTKANSLEWFKPKDDILLPYESANTDAGGSWYLVYKQSELPENAQAIYKDRDWSTGPCKACSRSEFLAYQAWSRYIEIHPFYISEDEEFDPEIMNFTYDKNYGINLEVSAYCDLTDFIIKQRAMFQDVLSKQVAIDFLREFAYNPNVRTNRHSINASKLDILVELDGDSNSMRQSGLSYELDIALKALSISTQGLDRVCLPCVNNGIKYRSI